MDRFITWEDGYMQAIRHNEWGHLPIFCRNDDVGRRQLLSAIECSVAHLRERKADRNCNGESALFISFVIQILVVLQETFVKHEWSVAVGRRGGNWDVVNRAFAAMEGRDDEAKKYLTRRFYCPCKEYTYLFIKLLIRFLVPVFLLVFLIKALGKENESANATLTRVAVIQYIMGSYGPLLDALVAKFWARQLYKVDSYHAVRRVIRLIKMVVNATYP